MTDTALYVIGKKGSGVLFVRTAPLRAAVVTDDTIRAYEAAHAGVDGYARIAAAARAMIADQDGNPATSIDPVQAQGIEAVIAGGAVLSEADFAFVGDVINTGWDVNRKAQMPIEAALAAVGPAATSTDLVQAVLSDTASTP
jgi:hypothetical protein